MSGISFQQFFLLRDLIPRVEVPFPATEDFDIELKPLLGDRAVRINDDLKGRLTFGERKEQVSLPVAFAKQLIAGIEQRSITLPINAQGSAVELIELDAGDL